MTQLNAGSPAAPAVAPAPTGAAPISTGGAPANPAPSGSAGNGTPPPANPGGVSGNGIFDGIATPEARGEAPAGATGEEGTTGEGAPQAGGTEGAEGAAGTPPAAAQTPPRLLAGRFTSPEDLEIAYGESSKEGQRLAGRLRDFENDLGARDREILDLKARLKATPDGFKELNDEELKRLREENPGAYVDYTLAKDRRDREVSAEKKALEAEKQETEDAQKQTSTHLRERTYSMRGDEKMYPGFRSLEPVMEELMDMAPEITGHKYSADFLYLASYGLQSLQAHRKGQTLSAEARAAAQANANDQAGHVGSAPAGGGSPAGSPEDGLDDLNRRIVKAAPSNVFRGIS